MIEHGGRQPTVKPALPASMFGQRMEQPLDRPDTVGGSDQLDLGMQGAEEPNGLAVDRRIGSGAWFVGDQTDRLRLPANSVAK